ncbi:hypothetical protein SprV_0401633500 [Sparganum proliferum]
MNKIILLGIFVAAAFAAPINQSTPTPPAPADPPVAKFFGVVDAGKTLWQGISGLFGSGKSTSPPPVPADQSTPTPPAPADSPVAKFFGDAGKTLWQGFSGLFGSDTIAKNATDRGNASSVVDLLGDFGSSLLRGVSGVLGQVSTGGITTGGGSVKEFLDIISMEATVQEAAIDKFLTENTGVIGKRL